MMNYLCVAINKTVLDKKVFSFKKDALDYFTEKYGEDIQNDKRCKEEKLLTSIAKYNKKLMNPEEDVKKLLAAKDKKQKELDELHRSMETVCCYYVWKFNQYKKVLLDESEILLFRICGIYKVAGERYEVVENLYKVVSKVVNNVIHSSEVLEKISGELIGEEMAMICVNKEVDITKIKKFISKIKLQILSEYKKNSRRILSLV